MARAFISYSRKDKEITRRILDALQERGFDIWIDLEGIPLTSDWLTEVHKGIENSDAFIFLLSPNSLQSKVCADELEHAQKNGKRLIPVVVRDLEKEIQVHPTLASIFWIFIRETDDFEAGLNQLIVALETDYEWVSFHSRLQVRALEWERKSRNEAYLLQGSELEEAEHFFANSINKEPRMTSLQGLFILASRQLSVRRQRRFTQLSVILSVVLCLAGFALGRFVVGTPQSNTSVSSGILAVSGISVLAFGGLLGYLSRDYRVQTAPRKTEQPKQQNVEKPDPLLSETIFISYKREDWKEYVKPLVLQLRESGYKVWIDQKNLDKGDNWMDKVNEALKVCQRLVLCVSPEALDSKYVKDEYRFFIHHEKTIFPVILKKAEMPMELLQLQSIPFAQLGDLIERLRDAGRMER